MSNPEAPERPADEGEEGRKRGAIWPRVLAAVASLLVLALAAAGIYAYTLDRNVVDNLNRADTLPTGDPTAPGGSPRPPKQTSGTLNYVLLGSDSRDPDNREEGRSDTLILVHLNAKRDKAYVISFPRDMWVRIPGHGKNKINAAFALGGPPLAVHTLESLTGDRMDHVVEADFEGFVQLTEDLGGVTVTNETAFSSHGFDYPKGKIAIAGQEALWFVRERKQLPRGDLDRAENQRKVIKAVVAKGLSADVVSDPARFTAFLGGVARNVTVDNSLSDSEIRETVLSLRLSGSDIELLQAPDRGIGTSSDGQSIVVVDEDRLAELSTALRTDTMAAYVKKYPGG